MAGFNMFKLSMLLTLLSDLKLGSWPVQKENVAVSEIPSECNQIKCPKYVLIKFEDDYEIRFYNSSMWATTSVIDVDSFIEATSTGYTRLFFYFRGINQFNERMVMTAPMLTKTVPRNGKSSFLVSSYIPKENQENPPPAAGITVKKWVPTFVAVRQFSGMVNDTVADVEAKALSDSLSGTIWEDAIKKSHSGKITEEYIVAQYDDPYKEDDRVNEIWFKFKV